MEWQGIFIVSWCNMILTRRRIFWQKIVCVQTPVENTGVPAFTAPGSHEKVYLTT
jgi:hypothetical protein